MSAGGVCHYCHKATCECGHVVTSPPAGVGDAQMRYLADEVRRLTAENARLRAEEYDIKKLIVLTGLGWDKSQSASFNVQAMLEKSSSLFAETDCEVRWLRAIVRECMETFRIISDDLLDLPTLFSGHHNGGCQCRPDNHHDGIHVCPFCMAVYGERRCREILGKV